MNERASVVPVFRIETGPARGTFAIVVGEVRIVPDEVWRHCEVVDLIQVLLQSGECVFGSGGPEWPPREPIPWGA